MHLTKSPAPSTLAQVSRQREALSSVGPPERSLSYACRTFDQLMQGEDYLRAKPVFHIGFLDFDLKHLSPEFYATFKLLNVNNHEIYSDKFVLSVVMHMFPMLQKPYSNPIRISKSAPIAKR